MRRGWWAACAAGLMVLAADAGFARAQLGAPAAAPVGVAPAGPVPGAAAVAAGADPAGRAGFFKRVCTGLDECRRKLCKTPAGQLLNNMTRPASALTGGVIPGFCPLLPSEKDLAQPGVAGAASAAQKDAAEAGARRDAVRFLGTLDCRYYPDSAVALAAALRTDGSECVRFEAALVLGRGCCCTQKTVDALEASVSGMETDGNPAERSVRVRCAAAVALEKCLACYTPPPLPPGPVEDKGVEQPLEKPREVPGTLPISKTAPPVLAPGSRLPSRESVEKARRTLLEFNEQLASTAPYVSARPGVPVAGRQSVFQLISDTADATARPAGGMVQPAAAVVPVPPAPLPPATTPPPVARPTPAPMSTTPPAAPVSRPAPMPVTPPAAPVSRPAPVPAATLAPPVAQPVAAPAVLQATTPVPPPPMAAQEVAPPSPKIAAPVAVVAAPPAPKVLPTLPTMDEPVVMKSVMKAATAATPAAPATAMPAPVAPAAMTSVMKDATAPPAMKSVLPAAATPPAMKSVMPAAAAPGGMTSVMPAPAAPAVLPAFPTPTATKPAARPADKPVVCPPVGGPAKPVVQPVSRVGAAAEPTDAAGWARRVWAGETPAARQAAVVKLAAFDSRQHPVVVETLLAGATNDPAPAVRVDCLRHLAACPAVPDYAYVKVWGLTGDADPAVSREAREVMPRLRRTP